jgi:hypothetical protein
MDPIKISTLFNDYISEKTKKWDTLPGDGVALCIGAGVTRDFIGTWDELLNEIAVLRVGDTLSKICGKKHLEADPDKLEDYIKDHFTGKCSGIECKHDDDGAECSYKNETTGTCTLHCENGFFPKGMNVLEQGEYLRDDKDDTSFPLMMEFEGEQWREVFFAAQVKYAIEKCISKKIENATKLDGSVNDIVSYFTKYKDDKKVATLREALRICLSGKVRYVITYNFDTVLEELLISDNICRALSFNPDECPDIETYAYNDKLIKKLSYRRPNKRRTRRKTVSIYHVHGIAYEDDENPLRPIIFSEYSYSDYQRNLFNWSNIRVADILSEYSLLCVGFSGNDANFRFLTHMFNDIKKSTTFGDDEQAGESVWLTYTYEGTFLSDTNNENLNAYACLKTYIDSFERYFKENFGIIILWTKDYKEMADRLKAYAGSV